MNFSLSLRIQENAVWNEFAIVDLLIDKSDERVLFDENADFLTVGLCCEDLDLRLVNNADYLKCVMKQISSGVMIQLNKGKGLLTIWAGRYCQVPLVWTMVDCEFRITTSVNMNAVDGSLDIESCQAFLVNGFYPSDRTWARYWRKVVGGQNISFKCDGSIEVKGDDKISSIHTASVNSSLVDYARLGVMLFKERAKSLFFGRKVGVLISGGADSRVVAQLAKEYASEVICYSIGDPDSSELEVARKICNTLCIQHVVIPRAESHYQDELESIKYANLGNILDQHYSDTFIARINDDHCDLVVSGCYFDYFCKGLLLSRRHLSIFGKTLPSFKLVDDLGWYHGFSFSGQPFYQETGYTNDYWYERIPTVAFEPDASGRIKLLHRLPYQWFLGGSDLLDYFCSAPTPWLVNQSLYFEIYRQLLWSAIREIPDNNYRISPSPNIMSRNLQFVFANLRDKFINTFIRTLDRRGSWLDWDREIEKPSWNHLVDRAVTRLRDLGVLMEQPENMSVIEKTRLLTLCAAIDA